MPTIRMSHDGKKTLRIRTGKKYNIRYEKITMRFKLPQYAGFDFSLVPARGTGTVDGTLDEHGAWSGKVRQCRHALRLAPRRWGHGLARRQKEQKPRPFSVCLPRFAGHPIQLVPDGEGAPIDGRLDTDGRFRTELPARGEYRLKLLPRRMKSTHQPPQPREPKDRRFSVCLPRFARHPLQLIPTGGGAPIDGRLDKDGRFRTELPEGTTSDYRLKLLPLRWKE